jgi:hypothetical protein
MRTLTILSIACIASAVLGATAVRSFAPRGAERSPIERGEYLVNAMVCNDCHTPWIMGENGPEPDLTRRLSGHPAGVALGNPPLATEDWPGAVSATSTAWAGPWGTSFTANLTPDPETGLGSWTVDEFVAAIRTGRHQGRGRQILPPMPWPMIRSLDDTDLHAIFAYLRSLPPISNRVPEPLPPAAH